MPFKKILHLFLMADIPSAKNRALYQRTMQLAKSFELTIITAPTAAIAPEIASLSTVLRIKRRWPFSSGILFKLYYTLVIVIKLIPINKLIVYSFHRNGFTAAGILKILKRKRMIWLTDMQHTPYYYWDYAAIPHLSKLKKIYYRVLGFFFIVVGKICLPKSDQVFAMSFDYDEGFAAIMERDFRVSRRTLFPIPNGVDISLVKKFIDQPARITFPWPNVDLRLLYAGNVRLERLLLFLDFLRELEKRDIAAILVTCGRITAAAEEFVNQQAHNKIVHLGYLAHNELLRLYSAMDACLIIIDSGMRDHLYSHPGKLFEAMCMGKIVLVSDLASIHRVVKDGENGLIVQNDRLAEGADRLLQILNSEEEMTRMSLHAKISVRILDWRDLNKKWLSQVIKIID